MNRRDFGTRLAGLVAAIQIPNILPDDLVPVDPTPSAVTIVEPDAPPTFIVSGYNVATGPAPPMLLPSNGIVELSMRRDIVGEYEDAGYMVAMPGAAYIDIVYETDEPIFDVNDVALQERIRLEAPMGNDSVLRVDGFIQSFEFEWRAPARCVTRINIRPTGRCEWNIQPTGAAFD